MQFARRAKPIAPLPANHRTNRFGVAHTPEQTDALLEDYIRTKLTPRLVWDKL